MSRILIKLIGLNPVNRSLILRSIGTNTAKASVNASTSNNDDNKASPNQLAQVEQRLVANLPRVFSASHQYNMYSKDVIFIDNIRNIRVQGITPYAMQVGLIKLYFAIKYSSISLELLNLVKNPEESYIRIRWRVIARPGLIRFMLFFWKFRSQEIWKDGISTMHVNRDGLIHCHVCDNIDIETEDVIGNKQKLTKSIKNPLVGQGLNV